MGDTIAGGDPGHDNRPSVSIREYIEKIMNERNLRYEQRFAAQEQALALQAAEYARRLHDLNGEYKRDRERQKDYVTIEKYEDRVKGETLARTAALLRVDEKFEDYIKRYEARQREVDLLLAAQDGAAREAKEAASAEGRRNREATDAQARKTNRNIGIVTVVLSAIVVFANLLPLLTK